VNRLLTGAIECLKHHGCSDENIIIIKVPGAFEIPVTAEKLAEQKKYDAIIGLGAIIRGGTPHFEYVAGGAANGIMSVSLKYKIPVVFGVLTTDNYDQALERSEEIITEATNSIDASKEKGSGNKGWDAALTAIEMADLFTKI